MKPGIVSTAVLILLAAAPCPARAAPGPAVGDVVDQVSPAQYRHYLDDLLYTHNGNNRGLSGPEHDPARSNICDELGGFGLPTRMEPFLYNGGTYYNVVAVQRGRIRPDDVYILGAHYDSVNNPGADDNASGVAAVLEAARVLSDFPLQATVIFVAFDREEQGLYGSTAYANAHAADNVLGMVSLDMIAYNPASNPNAALIYGRSASDPVKQSLAAAVGAYANGIAATVLGSLDQSDHAPFEWQGWQACLLIEGAVWSNPRYHSPSDSVDTPGYIDYAFATNLTRAAVGFLAESAGLLAVGDTDLDGDVDLADYQTFEGDFGAAAGATWTMGDFDGDGDVDFADYQALEANFGSSLGTGLTIPEPSAAVLLLAGIHAALACARRRRG